MSDKAKPEGKGAVVVLSGGQDSTTALFWAKKRFDEVVAISFDYDQRHKIELEAARVIAVKAGVSHEIFDAKFINQLAPNALTRKGIEIVASDDEMPNTFVDGRNLFFLAMAAVYAKQLGYHDLVTGVCETDFSGYPDCRQVFVDSLADTLAYSMEYPFKIHTPMMNIDKAAEVMMAIELGPECMDALSQSHTCYEGQFPPCGKCPACKLRAKGFERAGYPDPLIDRAKEWYFNV